MENCEENLDLICLFGRMEGWPEANLEPNKSS